MIDWLKLKPYETDQKKSFEMFCYQIAYNEFRNNGKFTSIDDSGGGDGVEFYVTFENGKESGWQCKFFQETDRLRYGNRKEQIKKSLIKSCKEHQTLKKWYLCTPSDFNTSEIAWFKNDLKASIQDKLDENEKKVLEKLDLVHWDKTELNRLLAKPLNVGIHHYFFGELEFDFNWFKNQANATINTLINQGKFLPGLHVSQNMDKYLDEYVNIEFLLRDIQNFRNVSNLDSINMDEYPDLETIYSDFILLTKKFDNYITKKISNYNTLDLFNKKNVIDIQAEINIYKEKVSNIFDLLNQYKVPHIV